MNGPMTNYEYGKMTHQAYEDWAKQRQMFHHPQGRKPFPRTVPGFFWPVIVAILGISYGLAGFF